jgi:predicted DNA-binding transcriptional regulator YafY
VPAGACTALAAALRQLADPHLQRCCAAALGELLFYADSQHRDAAGAAQPPAWDLSPEAVQQLVLLLQAGQDEVAQV